MADLKQSLNARTREESQKLDGFIQQKVQEIHQNLRKTEEEADENFVVRNETLDKFEREIEEQVRERRSFEGKTREKLGSISTKVTDSAIPLEPGLCERVEYSADDSMRDIQRQTADIQKLGTSLKDCSQEMTGTSEELSREKRELVKAEQELGEVLRRLEERLREKVGTMEMAVSGTRKRVQETLMELREEVASRTAKVREGMAAKEAELQQAMAQLEV